MTDLYLAIEEAQKGLATYSKYQITQILSMLSVSQLVHGHYTHIFTVSFENIHIWITTHPHKNKQTKNFI